MGALGARWGVRSESSFRNALKGILEDLDIRVEHIDDYDEEGMVYGQPSSVEIDIIIKNGQLMIYELKSSISKAEMFTFYKNPCSMKKNITVEATGSLLSPPWWKSKPAKRLNNWG